MIITLPDAGGFAAASIAVAIVPGPSWACVISSAYRGGFGGGLRPVAGNATGIVCHTLTAAWGLSAVIYHWPWLFTSLKWVGAAYLTFLATQMIRNGARIRLGARTTHPEREFKYFRDGLLVNAFNPKVGLLMLALLPQFVRPVPGTELSQIVALGALHVTIASLVLTGLVLVVSRAEEGLRRRSADSRLLRWVAGILLLACGLKLVFSSR